jgi:hypothetical protein
MTKFKLSPYFLGDFFWRNFLPPIYNNARIPFILCRAASMIWKLHPRPEKSREDSGGCDWNILKGNEGGK